MAELPRLPEHTELMGLYEDSGLTEERYLVRRSDGQVILLTALLFYVLKSIDGDRDLEAIATEVRAMSDKPVTAENIEYLLGKLRPMGVVETETAPVKYERADPLFGLALRRTVSPARFTNFLGTIFKVLFFSPLVIATVLAFGLADWWVFTHGHVTASLYTTLVRPGFLLATIGLILGGTLFHEIGHASACKYGGGRPGVIGFGMYLMLPCFYTNVTDAYRLTRRARLRTDLGGIFFNALTAVIMTAVFYFTGMHAVFLVLAILLINFQIAEQLLPIVRLDGYYVLSDLAGVPDLFGRIKPTLTGMFHGKGKHFRSSGLQRKARIIVTAWVFVTVPVLVFGLGWTLWHLWSFLDRSYHGVLTQYHLILSTSQHHQIAAMLVDVFALLVVFLPVLGLLIFALRALKKLWMAVWTRA